jgi:hypothetical protein
MNRYTRSYPNIPKLPREETTVTITGIPRRSEQPKGKWEKIINVSLLIIIWALVIHLAIKAASLATKGAY